MCKIQKFVLKPEIHSYNLEGKLSYIDWVGYWYTCRWAMIATRLPGRTNNEIKNYWNTHLRKRLLRAGIDPQTHKLITDLNFLPNFNNFSLQNLANIRLLENIIRLLNSNPLPSFLVGSNTLNPFGPTLGGIPNPSLQLQSPLLNVGNATLSGDYKPISDTFRPPEVRTEYCLPGLIPPSGYINYSPPNQNYGELLVDDEAHHSFWKDILHEFFPSSSL